MDASAGAIWFLGDLSDPWVVSIAEALPSAAGICRLGCTGTLPDRPFEPARPPRLIILHRHRLTAHDADRLMRWRDPQLVRSAPAVILCVSPYVRYAELERWSGLVDLVISEATAADI